MDATRFRGLLEDLDDSIDDLEDKVQPLVEKALGDQASQLPLLDKAKLYVLATYALESALFSYLRLNDVDAKSHPIFRELSRVKQYFEKIKAAESGDGKRENMRLDKAAAGRFVKAALAGNEAKARQEEVRGISSAQLDANQIAAGQKRAATDSDSDVDQSDSAPLKRATGKSKDETETQANQGGIEDKAANGPARKKAKQYGKKGNKKEAKRQQKQKQAQEQKRNPRHG